MQEKNNVTVLDMKRQFSDTFSPTLSGCDNSERVLQRRKLLIPLSRSQNSMELSNPVSSPSEQFVQDGPISRNNSEDIFFDPAVLSRLSHSANRSQHRCPFCSYHTYEALFLADHYSTHHAPRHWLHHLFFALTYYYLSGRHKCRRALDYSWCTLCFPLGKNI